jgi:hypothetical protein
MKIQREHMLIDLPMWRIRGNITPDKTTMSRADEV